MYVAQKPWHKRFATNLCNSKKREKIISSLSYYHTNSAWYVSCDFHFSSLQTFGGQGQTAGKCFIVKHFQSFLGGELNPPQRPLCVLERLEREKMKVGGEKWMGRGKTSCLFPLAIVYHVLTIFKLLPFFIGIPSVCFCGGERRWNYDVCRVISLLWLKSQLFRLSGSRVNVACHAGVLRVSSHIPASRTSLLWDRNA